jgi:hypothetical protein
VISSSFYTSLNLIHEEIDFSYEYFLVLISITTEPFSKIVLSRLAENLSISKKEYVIAN